MSGSKKYLVNAILREAARDAAKDPERVPAHFMYHGAKWYEYERYQSVAAEISIKRPRNTRLSVLERKTIKANRIVDAYKGVGVRINATRKQIEQLQSILQDATQSGCLPSSIKLHESDSLSVPERIDILETKCKRLKRPQMRLGAMITDMGNFAKRQGNEQAAQVLFATLG